MKRTPYLIITLLFLSCLSGIPALRAQESAADIYKDIKRLGVLANVLYVAAHPDDENTRLISYLSNHLHARTTYLSLTRGDGGQNLIGSEMRDMLGVIRTHELLQAREIDGGFQMFTRANDFGYSKTPAETFNIWGHDEILSDVVWAMRKVRPDVIINRFNTDTSRPNHGHHTASAILSVEAFDKAGDPEAFKDQLSKVDTWQPRRIFFNTSYWFYKSREEFDKADKSRMVVIDIGTYDAVTGESNSEIAGRSRSMHKSQGFGSAETRGESLDYIDLIADHKGTVPKTIFEGIDITWNRVPGGSAIGIKVADLEKNFDFTAPYKSVKSLLEIHEMITQLEDDYWRNVKLQECEDLIQKCLGLFVELRTNKFKAGPGTSLATTLEVINRSPLNVVLESVQPLTSDSLMHLNATLNNNIVLVKDIILKAPGKLSTPYWLATPGTEGLYSVSDQTLIGLGADDPAMIIRANFLIEGKAVSFNTPVVYRTIDPAEGEVYKPLSITPPVAIDRDAEVLMFAKGKERMVNLTLTAMQDSIDGQLTLKIPAQGWKIEPSSIPWSFARAGESIPVSFTITPPPSASQTFLQPIISIGNQTFHHTVSTIDYDHLPYMSVVRDATVKLQSMDIAVTQRPIAYIEGAGDDVDEGLQQLGFDVDVIEPGNISTSMLQQYQVVILGVRAFNTVEELTYKNKMLFDWVKAGGTMIVQYNVNRGLVTEDIAPYNITLSRDRITEESSPVKIIGTDHPALNFPNKITQADFNGWVQERGLYFPNQWNEHFIPLLEMNDTGEATTKGALLVAPYGEGYYVYSGLSWFRHLPAGVPGAYRLLSNLIALGHNNGKS